MRAALTRSSRERGLLSLTTMVSSQVCRSRTIVPMVRELNLVGWDLSRTCLQMHGCDDAGGTPVARQRPVGGARASQALLRPEAALVTASVAARYLPGDPQRVTGGERVCR